MAQCLTLEKFSTKDKMDFTLKLNTINFFQNNFQASVPISIISMCMTKRSSVFLRLEFKQPNSLAEAFSIEITKKKVIAALKNYFHR